MPILGIGLHLIIAVFFAIHAVRTNQNQYWLFILLMFPGLGSLIYFIAIFLPSSGLEHGARKAVTAVQKKLDPTRELREAKDAFDFTPTAQNQMRYASALLENGDPNGAANNFEDCLKGPFASDLNIRYNASRAFLESVQFEKALGHIEAIKAEDKNFRPEQIDILFAKALQGANRLVEAKQAFAAAHNKYGSFEALAEYTIFAFATKDLETASNLNGQLEASMSRWNKHTREVNLPIIRRLQTAMKQVTTN
ncbi:MAG: hypothetical protein AAB680_02665 [Pseudomonadota bacterium]